MKRNEAPATSHRREREKEREKGRKTERERYLGRSLAGLGTACLVLTVVAALAVLLRLIIRGEMLRIREL